MRVRGMYNQILAGNAVMLTIESNQQLRSIRAQFCTYRARVHKPLADVGEQIDLQSGKVVVIKRLSAGKEFPADFQVTLDAPTVSTAGYQVISVDTVPTHHRK